MEKISRHDFLKGAATGVAGLAAVGMLGGCESGAAADDGQESLVQENEMASASSGDTAGTKNEGLIPEDMLEQSALETDSIEDFIEEVEYDVVVIGAGASGTAAALAAAEEGASVCILQKQTVPMSQGKLAGYIDAKNSDELGLAQWVCEQMQEYEFEDDFNLLKKYADKSQEAMEWFRAQLDEAEFEPYIPMEQAEHVYEDSTVKVGGILFPESFIGAVTGLQAHLKSKGVKYYFETPAVQMVKEDGKVTGVIGKSGEGYVKVMANRGVILAAGDYQNNAAMVENYVPDAALFDKKQTERTGDGHLLGLSAGAQMEPIPHTKMVHASDKALLRKEPFLAVDTTGNRFLNNNIDFVVRNTVVRYLPEHKMISIFDSNYMDYVYGWGGDPTNAATAGASPEGLASAVESGLTLQADTLEDLADQMGVPVDAFVETVDRYNELCNLGRDEDFGTPSKYMKPVDTPPYYAQPRTFMVSAIVSGLITNDSCQCLNENMEPVEGLYAAGNCAGRFFGGVDYKMNTDGVSLGRAITFGYLAGKEAIG